MEAAAASMIPLLLIYDINSLDILLTERDIPSIRSIGSCCPLIALSIEQVVVAIQEVTTQVMQMLCRTDLCLQRM